VGVTSPRDDQRSPAELDVDSRFLLANERTLLAWTRTSLTFLVAGFGVQQFATDLRARELVSIVLMLLGALCAGVGALRHLQSDRAIRSGDLPKTGVTPILIAGGLALICLAGVLAIIAGAAS
jgi:putative membrane protein